MNELLLGLADDELIVGWRDSEWTGIAPALEEDVAFSSIAQNEIGHARAVYQLLTDDAGRARLRPRPGRVPLRAARRAPADGLGAHDRAPLAVRARRRDPDRAPEVLGRRGGRRASRRRSTARRPTTACTREMWADRLRDEPRFRAAVDELWPYALGVLPEELRRPWPSAPAEQADEKSTSSRTRRALRRPARALGGDDDGAAQRAGRAVVTARARSGTALAEIPDPEIPVISLVELGVVRDVEVDGARVRVEFTPTFLGCPALEAMRAQMEAKIADLGAEPEVEVDLRRLVVDRQDHPRGPREAARGRLRPARPARGDRAEARPAAVEGLPLPLLRLDGDAPGEHLRPDPVPLAPLLRELPPAVRAVQDDLDAGRFFSVVA